MESDKKNKVLTQSELEQLPKTTTAKNMRNIEDIMAEYIANGDADLDKNEKRLLDRQVHEKAGKRVGEFKNPKKTKLKSMPVVSSRNDGRGQKELGQSKVPIRKDVPVAPGVSVNGAIS